MRNIYHWLALNTLYLLFGTAAHADSITPKGKHLLHLLDSMDVENKWQRNIAVNWMTGEPLSGNPSRGTHCAGFTDAVARKIGVPINSPSDLTINPSANRQAKWLGSTGASYGWHKLNGPVEAQFAANRGKLVIATLDDSPSVGHVAIVRPANKSEAEILAHGPQMTQAGGVNSGNISAEDGFGNHYSPLNRIRYYSHDF